MGELISTFDEYNESYDDRLSSYLKKYVDNTESSFLSLELEKYAEYYKSLELSEDKVSENTFISLNRIIEFISKQHAILHSSNPVTTAIYTHGKLPRQSVKQKTVTPEKQKVEVKTETNTDKKEAPKDTDVNDYTKSTIEDCLFDIKNDINPDQYEILVDTLYSFFSTGEFPELENKIMFKSVNKKKVGWALKEAYRNLKIDKLSLEYLKFAKDNINLFENEEINSEGFQQSKFYKYFTTNPYK